MGVTILALLLLVVFVAAEEATCRADAYPSRLDQALEQLIVRATQRCVIKMGERYAGFFNEGYTRAMRRECCPIPVYPCPCNASDLSYGHIRLEDCLYD